MQEQEILVKIKSKRYKNTQLNTFAGMLELNSEGEVELPVHVAQQFLVDNPEWEVVPTSEEEANAEFEETLNGMTLAELINYAKENEFTDDELKPVKKSKKKLVAFLLENLSAEEGENEE